jgi:hypothetical protein
MPNYIPATEALHRAGRACYGDDWLPGLTPMQRDLLRTFPVGGPEPADQETRALVAKARQLDALVERQRQRMRAWLKSCGFALGATALIDQEAFETVLAHEFGTSIPPPPTEVLRPGGEWGGLPEALRGLALARRAQEAVEPQSSGDGPRSASESKIHEAITEAYDSARATGAKPPPVPGSVRGFELAVEQGRLLPNEDGYFDAAEVRTLFPAVTADVPSAAERLAEWIFARHAPGRNTTFDKLYVAACHDPELGDFAKAELQAAFQRVYDTKPHRPRATGWPLRSPYRERWQDTVKRKPRKSF